MSNDDLDLVETDDLLDALHRRQGPNGAILFVSASDRSSESELQRCLFRGGHIMALGLAVFAQNHLLNKPPSSYTNEA